MQTTHAIRTSFHALLQQYYKYTAMRCGVWNGAIAGSSWPVQAKTRALLFGLLGYVSFQILSDVGSYATLDGCPSLIQILTYLCIFIYKTTNFLLGVSHGRSMIPFCCRLANNSSRCGTRRFARFHALRDLDVLTHLQSGICIRTIEAHTEPVSALAWVPDGSGFISASQDRKINLWVRCCHLATCCLMDCCLCTTFQGSDGKQRDSWGITAIRITDLAVTPDFTRLVAVGESARDLNPMSPTTRADPVATSTASRNGNNNPSPAVPRTRENLMIVYDLTTKQPEL
jgi:hypothetical protein